MNRHLIRSAFLAASIAVTAFVPLNAGPAGCGNAFAAAAAPDAPGPFWARTYGGGGIDLASTLVTTPDGGYGVAGSTSSSGAGAYDAWVLRLSAAGNILWQKTFGGSSDDYAYSLVATQDGGFAVAGYTASFGAGDYDVWVLRLDAAGNILWQNTYGGGGLDYAYSLVAMQNGGFAVTGYTRSFGTGGSDAWLLRLDAAGNVLWQKTYGGSNDDYANGLVAMPDGGYAVAGYTYSFGAGGGDVWVLRLDAAGNVRWQKTYGGGAIDYAYSLVATPDGGYAAAGYTYSFGARMAGVWLLHLDAAGNFLWQNTYGGSEFDSANSLVGTPDGGYALAGDTRSFGAGNDDVWVLRLDAAGNVTWQKTYGGSSLDYAYSVVVTPEGGYAVAGLTESFGAGSRDAWLLRLAPNGVISPGCELVGTSTATVRATSGASLSTAATVAASNATVASSAAIMADSTADAALFCAYRPHR